jgi:hypothetical protein
MDAASMEAKEGNLRRRERRRHRFYVPLLTHGRTVFDDDVDDEGEGGGSEVKAPRLTD